MVTKKDIDAREILNSDVVEVLENNDWKISAYTIDDAFYVDLEWYSPLGEDFIATIWFTNIDNDTFIRSFQEYYEDFDPDEHATLWIKNRDQDGVPSSVRALIDDAWAINQHLLNTMIALDDFRKEN